MVSTFSGKTNSISSSETFRRFSFAFRNRLPIFLSILLFLAIPVSTSGQTDDALNRKFMFGQQLEKQGYLEEALSVYKQIYSSQLTNQTYFFKVRSLLEKLKKYDEWLQYLEYGLRQDSNNITLIGEQARAHFLSGLEDEAKQDWMSIIALDPTKETNYRLVSQLQQQLRLYGEAVATLQLGRKRLGNPKAFASDLAGIYFYRQEYKNAAQEYITMVTINPGYLKIAEQRINGFPTDSAVVEDVTGELESVVSDSLYGPLFRKLLSSFYIKNREFQKAFDSYITLDSLLSSEGEQIVLFADQALAAGSYSISEKAYTYILERIPKSENPGRAQIGIARSVEQRALRNRGAQDYLFNSEKDKKGLQQALDEYQTVTETFPGTHYVLEAYYRMGDINYHHVFDIDRAIAAYESARALSPQSETALKATITIGDCYIASGDTAQAARFYTMLNTAGENHTELKLLAEFKLILIMYYKGDIETVQHGLEDLFSRTPRNSDLSNDILDLILFIEENLEQDTQAFRRYIRSEFLMQQRKLSEAEYLLRENTGASQPAAVADDTWYKIAEIQETMGHYERSVATLRELVENFPESSLLEKTSIRIAQLFDEKLDDPHSALSEYERFLLIHSNSIYLDMVRERIRELREQ